MGAWPTELTLAVWCALLCACSATAGAAVCCRRFRKKRTAGRDADARSKRSDVTAGTAAEHSAIHSEVTSAFSDIYDKMHEHDDGDKQHGGAHTPIAQSPSHMQTSEFSTRDYESQRGGGKSAASALHATQPTSGTRRRRRRRPSVVTDTTDRRRGTPTPPPLLAYSAYTTDVSATAPVSPTLTSVAMSRTAKTSVARRRKSRAGSNKTQTSHSEDSHYAYKKQHTRLTTGTGDKSAKPPPKAIKASTWL